jgi:hypothetical protein
VQRHKSMTQGLQKQAPLNTAKENLIGTISPSSQ